jgi:hypothetical protein
MDDVMLVYMVLREGSGMSLWSMSTFDFVKDYVARKVMHALAEKWPSMDQNYMTSPEWRFDAVLEELYSTGEAGHASKKKKGITLESMSEDEMGLEIWVTPKWVPTYGVTSKVGKSLLLVRLNIPYKESIPDDIITLSVNVGGLTDFSIELDFRMQDQGHPPAFVQAHNLAFMLVIQADKMSYRILNLEYDPDSKLEENIAYCIFSHCECWDYPSAPSEMFISNYGDALRIGTVMEDSHGNEIAHGLLDYMETSEMYTLRSCREGELTLSFLKSKNKDIDIYDTFSSYYAVLEIMSRAKGIDIFYVHEKIRNPKSVDCATCIHNGIDNSGFKVFLYMDVGASFPTEEATDEAPATDAAPVRTPRYLGFFDRPAWVGIDLPPGTMHELQMADYEAELVDAMAGNGVRDEPDKEAEQSSTAQEPESSTAAQDPPRDGVPNRKRSRNVILQILEKVAIQPEVKIVPASSFKPREPLSADIVQKLKAYTEQIDWDDPSDQKYVDNLVNRLYDLYNELQTGANVQSNIDDIESELNRYVAQRRVFREQQKLREERDAEIRRRREELRRQSVANRKFVQEFQYHDPGLLRIQRRSGSRLFGTPSDKPQKAVVEKKVPPEWETWYKTRVSEEEHRVLVMMQQSNKYRSVVQLQGGPERQGQPWMYTDPNYRPFRPKSIEQVVFVCRTIGYFPTYYVYGETLLFPTDELKKFTVLVNQWCMQMNPEKLRESAEQAEDKEVLLQEIEELRPTYEQVSMFRRFMPKIAAEEPSTPAGGGGAQQVLTADMYIMALCGMVEKLMDDSGQPPRRLCG